MTNLATPLSQPSDGSEHIDLFKTFDQQFRTDQDCLEELYTIADREGLLSCRHCGSLDFERKHGARVIRCLQCWKNTWFTAGTFFERMRRPKYWLAAIWLMERGVLLSSSQFHKLVGSAQSTALDILKKIRTVIESCMGKDAVTVPSEFFSLILCKRSRETPARRHPRAELEGISQNGSFVGDESQSARVENNVDSATEKESDALELSEQEKLIYGMLSEAPVRFDTLCQRSGIPAGALIATLTMLELAGVAISQPGDMYIRHVPKSSAVSTFNPAGHTDSTGATPEIVAAFIESVRTAFHGISRKYLQKYLAAYWCHVDRDRWHPGAIVTDCLKFRRVSYRELLSYLSPHPVKIMPSA